jgi:hypothetical protein
MNEKNNPYQQINKYMGIKELDEILISQYGYNLYNYCASLAIILIDSPFFGFGKIWELKNAQIAGLKQVRTEIERLTNIKSNIRNIGKRLRVHLTKLPDWHQTKRGSLDESQRDIILNQDYSSLPNKDEVALDVYKLAETLNIIDEEINFLQNSMWQPFKKGVGRSANPFVLLHAFWSLVIIKHKNSDMYNVGRLIEWFAEKLKGTDYAVKLIGKSESSSIYRFRKENIEYLEESKGYFFPENTTNNIEVASLPKNFRIEFAKTAPDISVYSEACISQESPSVIFPDKTMYP